MSRIAVRQESSLGNRLPRLVVITVLLAVVMMVAAGNAFARSGGGEQFGVQGGSDGDSGDSGDIFAIVFYLLPFVIDHPAIGVPLLVAIIVAFMLFRRQRTSARRGYQAEPLPEAGPAYDKDLATIDEIRKRDPGFSESAFIERAGTAFVTIQKAWSAQDLSSARHFISSGVKERFETQFYMQKALGYRNNIQDIEIISSEIAHAFSDSHFDTLCVRFTARMKDQYVDLGTGEVKKENPDAPFTEYWTFLRRPGAKTLKNGGLVEGKCPNCGAEISMTDTGDCSYCKAFISSGEYDWLLAKIDQEGFPPSHENEENLPGMKEIAARDPAFSRAGMEDKVSVIFWRLTKTFFTGDAGDLKSCTLPAFHSAIEPLLVPDISGRRQFDHEAAIGHVSLVGIVTGRPDGMDEADVLVTSSARNAWIGKDGEISVISDRQIRRQTYRLVRKSGLKTHDKSSFRVVPCQKCGAPDDGNKEGKCPYCGVQTNEGDRDWVLEKVTV